MGSVEPAEPLEPDEDAQIRAPQPPPGQAPAAPPVETAAGQAEDPPPEAAPPPAPKATAPAAKKSAPPARAVAASGVSVYFRTQPIGAEIAVDDRPDWTCKTPCRLLDLPAGAHQVTAELAGFHSASRRIQLGANPEEIVQIRLEDDRVTALITSEPPGAEIYIDGRKQPETTNAKIPLARGSYQIKVAKAGYVEAEQVLVVEEDQIPFAKFVLADEQ